MSYIDQTDLEKAISARTVLELSDDDADGVSDTGVIDAVLLQGQSEVDGALRKRYHVPLSTPPQLVKTLALDVTVYRLFKRRAHQLETPKSVQAQYDQAVKQLNAIARGDIDVDADPTPAASAAEVAEASGPDREFTSETMKDF